MITLPGLIDPHVHFRTPGQSHKEDFITGTKAAIAGGFTTVLDMPNNLVPITTFEKLKEKQDIAKKQTLCDVGFYFGSLGDNISEFEKIQKYVFGIKLYLNLTTGKFIINKENLTEIYNGWNSDLPILVHAEEDVINLVIEVVRKTKKRTHICHASRPFELKAIIEAKKEGLPITCGVTPHHLFLSFDDAKSLGSFGMMKPPVVDGAREFLWENLKWIDCIESDHAPHTVSEKESDEVPFGVTGLETTLGLLLTASSEGKLSIEDIKRLCYENPSKIFNIKQDAKLEIDENEEWVVENSKLFTKSKWSPFSNRKLKGKVKKVFIRNTKVFDNGKFFVHPGFGKVLKMIE